MSEPRPRRGRVADDDHLFAADQRPALRAAVVDLTWLLDHGYTEDAALKLVGDRHDLSARQRKAVRRASATSAAAEDRRRRRVGVAALAGRSLAIDGFNALITVESALSHGTVIVGVDGAHRDLASVHGAYRQVLETGFAVDALGRLLASAGAHEIVWYLDRPVSSSGRLRAYLQEVSERRGWGWRAEVVVNPDAVLARTSAVVATSDAWILDQCGPWVDLLGELLRAPLPTQASGPTLAMRPDLWLVDLSGGTEMT
ncbi:MAG: DUF434 domain-containing protein [Myxococcales bacterium]|nr:DUF434 domain-containing protein [Myxococcales bacterium]